jgi:hypothetical protein
MLGDELFRECEDMIDLRSIVEIDRPAFLRLYADLSERGFVDKKELAQAEAIIDRLIDRVESILSSYRMNRSCVDRLLRCDLGRMLWNRYMDVIRRNVYDCITGYVEDLYNGRENERDVLGSIEKWVHHDLSALYHTLNDEGYLIELALVQCC